MRLIRGWQQQVAAAGTKEEIESSEPRAGGIRQELEPQHTCLGGSGVQKERQLLLQTQVGWESEEEIKCHWLDPIGYQLTQEPQKCSLKMVSPRGT